MTIETERAALLRTFTHAGLVRRKTESTNPDTGETVQVFAVLEKDATSIEVLADKSKGVFLSPEHGLTNGTKGRFSGDELPDGIMEDIDYFVVASTDNSFKVSLTAGGDPVTFTTNGSDVVFTVRVPVGSFPCALSLRDGGATQTDAVRVIRKAPVLFTRYNEDLETGDHVEVTLEDGAIVQVVVGSISKYPTHIEAAANLLDEARA